MFPVIWSAIGILAAGLFGSIYFSVQRMDSGFARLENKMDQRFAQVDERFARVDARFDVLTAHVDARFDAVTARLDATNARLDLHIHPHTG